MTEKQAPSEKKQANATDKEKKLYRKPAFRYEQVFETRALSCGKLVINSGCQFSRKTS